MNAREISEQLERIGTIENFPWHSIELTDRWTSEGVGFEAVEPILEFMENHPEVDLGGVGALVHFSETFYRHGYEEKLLESISRKPVSRTISMLNRLINGTQEPATKQQYVDAMIRAKSHRLIDLNDVDQIDGYLKRFGTSEI